MADNSSPAKLQKTNPEGFDGVIIGGHHFVIDRKLFVSRSAVFRRAFQYANTQRSGSDSPISSDDLDFNGAQNCEASTFNLYKRYVETGEFHNYDVIDEEFPVPLLPDLMPLYALAWQLEDYTAANFFMDMIILEMAGDEHEPDPHHIAWAYQAVKSAGDCPLRRLLVDFQIHHPRLMHEIPFTSCHSERHAHLIEFLQDVVAEYRCLTQTKGDRGLSWERDKFNTVTFSKHRPGLREPCYYHKHNEDHLECHTREVSLGEQDEEEGEDEKEAGSEDEQEGDDEEEAKQEADDDEKAEQGSEESGQEV